VVITVVVVVETIRTPGTSLVDHRATLKNMDIIAEVVEVATIVVEVVAIIAGAEVVATMAVAGVVVEDTSLCSRGFCSLRRTRIFNRND
jgi:hypothetical protein